MSLKGIGEFGLIDDIRKDFASGDSAAIGIGDDCAVIPQQSGLDTLVSTDMLMEGTHFLLSDISAWELGWKSAAVNISDIAAMGGKPIATFLSFALPKTLSPEWIKEFMEGYRAISEKYGVALLGGDTTSSPDRLCINVAVMGTCPSGKAKLRSTAKPGDLICVTGNLGDSATGLKLILEKTELSNKEADTLKKRHHLPCPRVEEGLRLSELEGVHAMMDISDGIGSDIRHILEESKVSAVIDTDALPLSAELKAICDKLGWDAKELAISGGEDYELLFTVTPECEASLDIPHTVIGTITESKDPAITWKGSDRDYCGFRHF